jgi:hypothetical protein
MLGAAAEEEGYEDEEVGGGGRREREVGKEAIGGVSVGKRGKAIGDEPRSIDRD